MHEYTYWYENKHTQTPNYETYKDSLEYDS